MRPESAGNELAQQLRKTLPRLAGAGELLWSKMLDLGVKVTLNPGQFVCMEGDHCRHLPLVLSGSARVYAMAPNGREVTLYRIVAGETCVLTAATIVSSMPFPAFAISEVETEAFLLPPEALGAWLDLDPVWRSYVFSLQASRLQGMIGLVSEFSFERMDRRIASFLLTYSGEADVVEITHAEVATELGTSREVVSRLLKAFERAGLLELGRGSLKLRDRAGLVARGGRC